MCDARPLRLPRIRRPPICSTSASSRSISSISTPGAYTPASSSSNGSSASIPSGASSSDSPPVYGSQTISSVSSFVSVSSTPQTFASSGSQIGTINPHYSLSNTVSDSSSRSLSLSSGGVRTSESAISCSFSFLSQPPIYTGPSMSTPISESESSIASSSSEPSITFAPS